MTPQKMSGRVYAGYQQFYVFDADHRGDTAASTFLVEDAFKSRLPLGRGVVGVLTSTYGEVPVTVETTLDEPSPDLIGWAHVIEAPLHLTKGKLHIVGCPDEPTNMLFQLPPGDYIVRVSFSLVIEKESNEWAGDSYLIQIFPGKARGRQILKAYTPVKST